MNKSPVASQVGREVSAINATFRQHGVRAGVVPKNVLVSPYSHIEYGVSVAPGQTIAVVEKRMPEITNAIARLRKTQTPVMFSWNPLSISVPFPNRAVMPWDAGQVVRLDPGVMLLGRSFDRTGARMETTSFEESPHILVAGTTGAGKSVLLQSMITSLCANAAPAALRLVLVDLKNEDLTPFAAWPHVTLFARTAAEAEGAIMRVQAEKKARIMDPGRKPYRLVLVIDELAQLAEQKHIVTALGDVASIGRSKLINLIVATQHPTEKGGMGSMMRANFPLRLIGMVAPGMSYAATQRPGLHADMLPGDGSFLRIQANDVRRFQTYLIEPADIAAVGAQLPEWAGADNLADVATDDAPLYELPEAATTNPVVEMAEQIRSLWEDGASLAAMIREVYGPTANTGGSNRNNVLSAVEYLRATTTTRENATSLAESDSSSESSSSSSDGKVIKLRRVSQ